VALNVDLFFRSNGTEAAFTSASQVNQRGIFLGQGRASYCENMYFLIENLCIICHPLSTGVNNEPE
jgi:hypothetical protein